MRHDTKLRTQLMQLIVFNFVSVKDDLAFCYWVHSQKELEDSGLPTARAPHKGNFLSFVNLQGEIPEHKIFSCFVFKSETFKLYVSFGLLDL